MRCEDFNALLDQDHAQLMPEQRQLAERHLARCAECGEAWTVYRRCAALPVPQTPPDLAARVEARIDRGAVDRRADAPQRAAARRIRPATLMTGGFLLFGAALAATLAYLDRSPPLAPATDVERVPLTSPAQSPPEALATAPVADRSSPIPATASRAGIEPPATEQIETPRFAVDPSTVLVLPSSSSRDSRLPGLLEDVVAALRESNGLNVLEPERAMSLIEAGLPEERISELLGAGHVLLLELPREGATFINATLLDGASGLDVAFINVMSVERVVDNDWSRQAASIAEFVQERVDPRLHEARTAAAREAVLNTGLDELERLTALTRVPRSVAGGVSVLPDDVVHAAVDMAAGSLDPSIRAQVWRVMRGTRHPYVLEPLLESLRSDADSDVRAAAADTLEDYSADPAVRAALERARDTDISDDVRARAAESLLSDEEQRLRMREHFLDEDRPPFERLRAMLDYARLADIDDEMAQTMIRFARSGTSPSTAWHALGTLRHPAFVEPLLEALRRERDASVRTSIVFGLSGFIDRPAVRERLVETRDEDPDFEVRRAAASVLRDGR